MTRNKLSDLNNTLFEQLERVNDDSLTSEQLADECKRSKAITLISGKIIDNARLGLQAATVIAESTSARETLKQLPESMVRAPKHE